MRPGAAVESPAALGARQLEHCAVYPTIRVPARPSELLMGVFDASGDYVAGTALDRSLGEQGSPIPRGLLAEPSEPGLPEAVYAGPLYFHFGHFLLESLARTWYARQHPDVPLLWSGAHTWQGRGLAPWQQEMLDILGVTNPVRIVADPTRVDRLHIPDLGFRYDDRFHPEHAAFLGRYDGPAQITGQQLWLSRSGVRDGTRRSNSGIVERRLEAAGWVAVLPERLSIREQLNELCRAEVIAGEEGSAFHTLVLLRDVSAKRFQILRRHGPEHQSLHTIGDARGVNQTFYTLEQDRVLEAKGRLVSKISPNTGEVLDLLGVPVPDDPDRDPATADDDRIVGRIVASAGPGALLDVGGTSPQLVLGSDAAQRIAVSTRFAFDPRAHRGSGVRFHELGLDQYINVFHEDGQFDVICVGGPTFEDVMASFGVSKRVAHDRTLWILGVGRVAATCALAVDSTHPGFRARRLVVNRKFVFVVERAPDAPTDEATVGTYSADEVRTRTQRMPTSGIGILGSVGAVAAATLSRLRAQLSRQAS